MHNRNRFRCDRRGSAAIEFAFIAPLVALGLLNAIELGRLGLLKMEVATAAQAGAQQVWNTCNSANGTLPATQKCANLQAAIARGVQSTSLGTDVGLASGYPSEGYYCVTSANTLQLVGGVSSAPSDCSAAGNASAAPGDYIVVRVTYNYAPLFPGITLVGGASPTSLVSTSWLRLG